MDNASQIVACAEESVVVANAPTPIATKINRARRWVLDDYFAAPPAARKALCVDLSQFPGNPIACHAT
jgi:hypothetical protein